ncbi:alpha/beta fold hydrolase [Leifsonia shinshuensis]|uniref:Pimeloyl-ACP methyl ester carboxylesterase n=1 Tax=Leifsonia shinshuensis TaxID=150026 RepID=A0A853D3N4_9MICO|nr:alpha/beta hydrolase [Leifsonia shinshuensis]NYJ25295.1 pimeloyl-ACP methyl ester carboxylesterase [Leifsonia shinshuensis]
MTAAALPAVAYGDPAAPPLVFLRGLPSEPGRARGLDALTERLIVSGPARTHRVYAVGRPAELEPGATMAEVAAIYAATLRRRFRTPAAVMGVSTGASIALQLAVDHPGLVGSLVVAAGAAALGASGRAAQRRYADLLGSDHPAATSELAVATMDAPLLAPAVRLVTRLLPGPADPVGLRALVQAEDGYDVRDRLSEVSAPVLVVSGGRDFFYPLKLAAETVRGLPHARHVVYLKRSHAGVPLHPRFGRDVGDFLRAQTGADLRAARPIPYP